MDFESNKIRRSPNQISCDLDGEIVIMDSKSGDYYKMNSIGTRIWELITNPLPIEEIVLQLQREYEIDNQSCRQEVANFIENLSEKKLIIIV